MSSELWQMFWQGSLKVMNKCSSSNCNRTLIQGYQVFNYVLKMLAHKLYLFMELWMFVECLFFLKLLFFFYFQRT